MYVSYQKRKLRDGVTGPGCRAGLACLAAPELYILVDEDCETAFTVVCSAKPTLKETVNCLSSPANAENPRTAESAWDLGDEGGYITAYKYRINVFAAGGFPACSTFLNSAENRLSRWEPSGNFRLERDNPSLALDPALLSPSNRETPALNASKHVSHSPHKPHSG
jgi:hypothetical protein